MSTCIGYVSFDAESGETYPTHSYQGAFVHFVPIPDMIATASGQMVVSSLGPTLSVNESA